MELQTCLISEMPAYHPLRTWAKVTSSKNEEIDSNLVSFLKKKKQKTSPKQKSIKKKKSPKLIETGRQFWGRPNRYYSVLIFPKHLLLATLEDGYWA